MQHPTLDAIRELLPEAETRGGSFAEALPAMRQVAPDARAATLEKARDAYLTSLLRQAGVGPLRGHDEAGQPLWPQGVRGSVTHKGTVVLVSVTSPLVGHIGIDLERRDAVVRGIAGFVCPEGRPQARDDEEAILMAFSAKEAAYKSLYPAHLRRMDFRDIPLSWTEAGGTTQASSPSFPGLQVRARALDKWVVTAAIYKPVSSKI